MKITRKTKTPKACTKREGRDGGDATAFWGHGTGCPFLCLLDCLIPYHVLLLCFQFRKGQANNGTPNCISNTSSPRRAIGILGCSAHPPQTRARLGAGAPSNPGFISDLLVLYSQQPNKSCVVKRCGAQNLHCTFLIPYLS